MMLQMLSKCCMEHISHPVTPNPFRSFTSATYLPSGKKHKKVGPISR
ncbi:unnamed protein product [Musa banksii]